MKEKVCQIPEKKWRHGYTQDMEGYGVLYEKGLVTAQSLIYGENKYVKRPLAERLERAIDYKEVMNKRSELRVEKDGNKALTLREEIRSIFNRAKKRDQIYTTFLQPKSISIDMSELGVQKADYADLITKDTHFDQPPIIFITGISSGIDGVGELPIELVLLTNKRVIVLTHPESWGGTVTKDFVKAVRRSKKFEPHTEFFKLTIKQILEERGIDKFDICGVSAGAVIASEIIKDKEFFEKIGKKNFIVPPGITPVYENIFKRLVMQYKTIKDQKKKNYLPNSIVANIELIRKDKSKIKLQKKTLHTMAWKLGQKYPWWEGLGEVNVIIAEKDAVTYGIKYIDKVVNSNPKLKVRVISGGHEIVGAEPKKVIEQMNI